MEFEKSFKKNGISNIIFKKKKSNRRGEKSSDKTWVAGSRDIVLVMAQHVVWWRRPSWNDDVVQAVISSWKGKGSEGYLWRLWRCAVNK